MRLVSIVSVVVATSICVTCALSKNVDTPTPTNNALVSYSALRRMPSNAEIDAVVAGAGRAALISQIMSSSEYRSRFMNLS